LTRSDLLHVLRSHSIAVQASVSDSLAPQAAVVGFVVTDTLELFFDTVEANRKVRNLRKNPRIAFVIGGMTDGDERTVQYEGIADEPRGKELEQLKEIYFRRFPDGRDRLKWPGIMYFRVKPTWVKLSNYDKNPPEHFEFDFTSKPLSGTKTPGNR